MRYYIADCHFFDTRLNNELDKRGFSSVEEMNEYMIKKWNAKVRPCDEIVILGDFSCGRPEDTKDLIARLQGKMYLLKGNHDRYLKSNKVKFGRFKWVKEYAEMKDNKRKVILCHYPIIDYKQQYTINENGTPRSYMLYGHVHDSINEKLLQKFQDMTKQIIISDWEGNVRPIPCNMINCFCMYSDYEPLTLDEWIECDRKRKELPKAPNIQKGTKAAEKLGSGREK